MIFTELDKTNGMSFISRFIRSAKSRGLWQTLRLITFALGRVGRMPTTDLGRQVALDTFEREHGVDINGFIELGELEIVSPNKTSGVRYGATAPKIFRTLIESLPILHKQFTFIDFGSGKGAVLLYASEYPFKEIYGVEFSPELHNIAERNIALYRGASVQCAKVTPLCIDAADYAIPEGPLVLYFNIPFGLPVWKMVLNNLNRALLTEPRNGYLILLNYGWDQEAALFVNSTPFLRCILDTQSYRIYELVKGVPDKTL